MSTATAFRFAVNVTPKEGILDPQGRAVESSLPHLGVTGVSDVRVGRRVELSVDAADRGRRPGDRRAAGRRAPQQPAHRGLRGRAARDDLVDRLDRARRRGAGLMVRIGVVVFPGSNRDIDALNALRVAGAEPVVLWHESADLAGVDGIVLPGGFAYGDYLRAGVIARFSPVMRSVAAFAADGGLVLGICNGFQVLTEAGLLPGALLRNRSLRFVSRRIAIAAERLDSPFTRSLDAAGRSGCRSPTARAASSPTRRRSTRSRPAARSCSATSIPTGPSPATRRTGPTRTGRSGRSPG